MRTVQKLQHNLIQSQKWSHTFKQEIKRLMQEITNQNQNISKIKRECTELNDEMKKNQSQLKMLLDDRQRNTYKRDKLQIKVQEMQSRVRVYQQAMNKKYEWNKQLKRKLKNLQRQVQNLHNTNSIEQIFEDISQSNISISSFCSNSSSKVHKSKRQQNQTSQLDYNNSRISQLQLQHLELTNKCKQREEEMVRLKKNELKLKEKIKLLAQDHKSNDKQNKPNQTNLSVEQMSKQTRNTIKRMNQLQQKHSRIKQNIESQRTWINKYVKYLDELLQCEHQTEGIKNEIAIIERQAKKERKTMQTIFSYMLNDHSC